MNLQGVPIGWFVFGAAALAGVLFLLQRLRVRHRDLRVPTTLFWKEAVERARARSLVERFRHLWAYLLVLAIALALWGAAAAPAGDGDENVEHLVLIDASAGMAVGDRFEQALAAADDAVARLPRGATTVRLCGGVPQTVLLPGESPHLLGRRLQYAAPEAAPSSIDGELHRLPRGDGRKRRVLVVGGRPIDAARTAQLPEGAAVERLPCVPSDAAQNAGITALAVTEAASGRYDACDLFVEVRGAARELRVQVGEAAAVALEATGTADGSTYTLSDVVTDGARVVATLVGDDALSFDDRAELVLPRRRVLRVQPIGDLPAALRGALLADAAVEFVDASPDVVIGAAGTTGSGGVPALEFAPMADADGAIVVRAPDAEGTADDLVSMLGRLGLEGVDWMDVATTAGRAVSFDLEAAETRSVQVWSELCTERFDFTRSRAFPMFVAASVRWLAGESAWLPWVAAGEPAPFTDAAVDDAGWRFDPVGARFVAPIAGSYRRGDGETPFHAALLSPTVTVAATEGDVDTPELAAASPDWALWFAVIALVLLCGEWLLYRTGRMP